MTVFHTAHLRAKPDAIERYKARLLQHGHNSLVLERAFSEYSRVRLQFARDQARADVTERLWFVQYQASLGAHGAHQY